MMTPVTSCLPNSPQTNCCYDHTHYQAC
uniref:Uncharacterized protein n=1 Tax=Arundo donax TaxID=35708 RepID=A0A0A8YTZ9_ARUDO